MKRERKLTQKDPGLSGFIGKIQNILHLFTILFSLQHTVRLFADACFHVDIS